VTDNVYDCDRFKNLLYRYSDILVFYAVSVGTYVVKDFGTFFRVRQFTVFLNTED
jgi:hypothetical protein